MPDPAIAAFNAGLPYTELTNHGLFGRKKPKPKVTFVTNPDDPFAAPRKVIDVDGGGSGWWGRKWGGRGVVWDEKPPPHTSYKSMSTRSMPIPSSHSPAQGLSTQAPPRPAHDTGIAHTYTYSPAQAHLHPHLLVEPLPDNFWSLPWRERRHLEKMRADQEKMVKDWDKAQRQWEKAQAVEAEKRSKVELKAKRAELKAKEKELKRQSKNPHRRMPMPTPALATAAEPSLAAPPQPQANAEWMMTPTMEEFGVRRPFDTLGGLPQAGPGEWPMMSRTMTHAMIDMGREERVHAVSAGTVWGGGWGGHW